MSDQSQLTRRQERAIPALLSSQTVVGAAQIAGVGESSLRRWLTQPNFQHTYQEARRQAVQQALTLAQRECAASVETWVTIRDEPNTPPGMRLRAAELIVNLAIKGVELEGVEQRLNALEECLASAESENGQ